MSEIKVLLVDDDPDILEFVEYNLRKEGFEVFVANNGEEAIGIAKKEIPSVILLDVMMPGMDGMETCEAIRELPGLEEVMIAFLTARGEDYSQIAGFDAGADDYITKPIKPRLLISRINALLRRTQPAEANKSNTIEVANLVINREQYNVTIDGNEIVLPRKEFELLCLLAEKPGKVFNRDEIMDRVWGNEVVVGGRTIDVHIRKLREKIGEDNIKTIKGVGYKFDLNEV